MKDNSVSVCLSIYNQEAIIDRIILGILNNMSNNVKELIIVLDGITDKTEVIVRKILSDVSNIKIKIIETPDIWEVKANNASFKAATCPYIITVQDDMEILEKNFDKRLAKPFKTINNILGVTARTTQNERIVKNTLEYYDVAGKDVNTPRNLFCIRQVIVRGPIMFDHSKLIELNYLDEDFAPITCDEKDLCFRGYRKGWIVGAYAMNYNSPLGWGKTHEYTYKKQIFWTDSSERNEKRIIERHSDLLNEKPHNQDIIIK